LAQGFLFQGRDWHHCRQRQDGVGVGRCAGAVAFFKAVETKLREQANYVVWRDTKVKAGQPKKNSPADRRILPDSDPGFRTAERWRKRLCIKEEKVTKIDADKLDDALEEAQARCQRVCEQEPKSRRSTMKLSGCRRMPGRPRTSCWNWKAAKSASRRRAASVS
jgi:hypothetical protein